MEHVRTMVDADITATHPVTVVEVDAGHKTLVIGAGGRIGRTNSNLTHYCWTHIMCAHPGKDYRKPADGH